LGFSNFNFAPTSNFGPGEYDLLGFGSYSGGGTEIGSNSTGTIGGYPASLAIQDNELVVNVVPEPSTIALLAIGLWSAVVYYRFGVAAKRLL
jgi:hypothetical protein